MIYILIFLQIPYFQPEILRLIDKAVLSTFVREEDGAMAVAEAEVEPGDASAKSVGEQPDGQADAFEDGRMQPQERNFWHCSKQFSERVRSSPRGSPF
jgi:hypothetical protein